MTLMTEELAEQFSTLEDSMEKLDLTIKNVVEKSYKNALSEHTSMTHNEVNRAWLQYNATHDDLGN